MVTSIKESEFHKWPGSSIYWVENSILYISIPFTWELPVVKSRISQLSIEWNRVIVGGPATRLMPDYFNDYEDYVTVGNRYPGVLQKVNSYATRTTIGCPRKCGFCGVKKIEPDWEELEQWPDLPVICDNNILAASITHFDKVCDKLERWKWADFNQGIDARLLTKHHAERLKRIGHPIIRLALDNDAMKDEWSVAYELLRSFSIQKSLIRSYVLIGFTDTPESAWDRCNFVEKQKIDALPMWYHPLDSFEHNKITDVAKANGWNDYERRKIMQWFYWHKKAVGA